MVCVCVCVWVYNVCACVYVCTVCVGGGGWGEGLHTISEMPSYSGTTLSTTAFVMPTTCPALTSPSLGLFRMLRGLPADIEIEFPSDHPLHTLFGRVYTRVELLQSARSERKEALRVLSAAYRSHPSYNNLRNEINAMFASPCDGCHKLVDKISYCARCQAVAYCGRECQAADYPRHKKECRRIASGGGVADGRGFSPVSYCSFLFLFFFFAVASRLLGAIISP